MKNSTKKIFFNLRPTARPRMRDTVYQAKAVCKVHIPPAQVVSISAELPLWRRLWKRLRAQLVRIALFLFPRVNEHRLPSGDYDLYYLWGAFPKDKNKPFVVELDNPYALTHYSKTTFEKRKRYIKNRLMRAKAIACMSETCRAHLGALLGEELYEKAHVLYPYMPKRDSVPTERDEGTVTFLAVGLNPRLKGFPELVHAFLSVPDKRARLLLVVPHREEYEELAKGDSRITVLPPQKREELFSKIYPKGDILVLPSLYESFGLVLLEALSFGLGIITTDTYASKEMVKNGLNGRVLPHPFLKTELFMGRSACDCVSNTITEFSEKHLQGDVYFENHEKNIHNALKEALSNAPKWKHESRRLFAERFSPETWRKNFVNIIS